MAKKTMHTLVIQDQEYEITDAVARSAIGAPAVATTAADMIDTTKVYVYIGSESGYTFGNWYYHNGTAWTSGGVYQSKGIGAGSVNGQKLSEDLKEAFLDFFAHVALTDANGQTYYNNLLSAFNSGANLVSIEAVYTQSGTVYDTASLDDLRTDLVVTAYYDDETSRTVNSYELSGTLTVGTSVITVNYGGKTTTFNVLVIVKPTVAVENGAVSVTDGSESASTTRARTDYIPCVNRTFSVDAKINTSNIVSYACRYFDASKNYIGHSASSDMTPSPDHAGGGEYLVDGWPIGNGTSYVDAAAVSGTVAYVRFLMRTTSGTETITDVSGTITVDGTEYNISYS